MSDKLLKVMYSVQKMQQTMNGLSKIEETPMPDLTISQVYVLNEAVDPRGYVTTDEFADSEIGQRVFPPLVERGLLTRSNNVEGKVVFRLTQAGRVTLVTKRL